jgi:hypothetical protein
VLAAPEAAFAEGLVLEPVFALAAGTLAAGTLAAGTLVAGTLVFSEGAFPSFFAGVELP